VVGLYVCLSVYVCVLATSWSLQNGWTNRDAVWDEDLGEPKPCIRRCQNPHGKVTFEACRSGPMGNHCKSNLCNNHWTLTFAQYTIGELLPLAIYRCSSLGDGL